MSLHKRTAVAVVVRHLRQYHMGDRVRILRGKYAGQVMTVHQSANDWVTLNETMQRDPSRYVMSKGNVEPEAGFTEEELTQARRAAEKMQGLGSLI